MRTDAARLQRLLGVTATELEAVLLVAREEPLAVTRLQADLGLSPGGAAALVSRLEEQALACREADPSDPCAGRLRLTTAAARELAAAAAPR
jgi:DNA-binding MarR family transcriptional regulator